jgi:L-aspartate oxidase
VDIFRYLVDFDPREMEKEYYDAVIIGSGIAGVYTALEIPGERNIAILTKESIDMSNSVLAQGGIAVSLDKEDSPELHFKDTLYAGAGLCDEESVWVLVNEAAFNIDRLCGFGINFDQKSPGELALSREAAHSKNRIIHAGDTTGKEICDKLISGARAKKNIHIKERTFALDLLTEGNSARGVLAFDESSSAYKLYLSGIVVCATGGYGQLYAGTTNPEVATGDGISLAYRAGAELMDLEFVQFHPTVLYHPENKNFLISEAVRGEGALLRNIRNERFMPRYHELAELAPRDVVARAITREMEKTGADHVYLDITFKDREYLENRFPNIFKTCLDYGIDISRDYIPIAPAEHYCMGGIKTDTYGRTNINGFFACGEAACNGIHGANRLASNSLLEGLVFGHIISREIGRLLAARPGGEASLPAGYSSGRRDRWMDESEVRADIQRTMTEKVGIVRDGKGLAHAREKLERYRTQLGHRRNETVRHFELQNMLLLAGLVTESALEREESRGAHYRRDFEKTDDVRWKRHIVKRR